MKYFDRLRAAIGFGLLSFLIFAVVSTWMPERQSKPLISGDLYDNGDGTGEIYFGNGGYEEVTIEDGIALDIEGNEYIIGRRFDN